MAKTRGCCGDDRCFQCQKTCCFSSYSMNVVLVHTIIGVFRNFFSGVNALTNKPHWAHEPYFFRLSILQWINFPLKWAGTVTFCVMGVQGIFAERSKITKMNNLLGPKGPGKALDISAVKYLKHQIVQSYLNIIGCAMLISTGVGFALIGCLTLKMTLDPHWVAMCLTLWSAGMFIDGLLLWYNLLTRFLFLRKVKNKDPAILFELAVEVTQNELPLEVEPLTERVKDLKQIEKKELQSFVDEWLPEEMRQMGFKGFLVLLNWIGATGIGLICVQFWFEEEYLLQNVTSYYPGHALADWFGGLMADVNWTTYCVLALLPTSKSKRTFKKNV